jgi:tetratricopeptide (TPR) repeat protein
LEGKYEELIKHVNQLEQERILEKNDLAYLNFYKGLAYLSLGDEKNGLEFIKTAFSLNEDLPNQIKSGTKKLCYYFAKEKQPELVKIFWKKWLEKNKDKEKKRDITFNVIKWCMENQLFELANELIDYSIYNFKLEKEDLSYLYNEKGRAYSFLGDDKKALYYYDLAIEIDPQNKFALFNKALKLYWLKKYKEAIELFDKLIEIWPYEKAYYYRAITKLNYRNGITLDSIMQDLKKASGLNPTNEHYKYLLEITPKIFAHEQRLFLRDKALIESYFNDKINKKAIKEINRWHKEIKKR